MHLSNNRHIVVCLMYVTLLLTPAHKWIGPPSFLVEGLLSTEPTPSSFYLLVEMGLPLNCFHHTCGKLDMLFIKRHHHKDLKWTKLCLGPIETCLEAFLGFLGNTKVKAYTKLNVVMCCQIFYRKSVAPSSGRPVDKIRNFERKIKKNIKKVFYFFYHCKL